MVTFSTAENALKSLYLGVVSEQLNTKVNPLLAKIEQTTSDVWGKEIIKLAPWGLNGGVGAGSETGALPLANENNYAQFKLTLKNIFGSIELSDKAIQASQSSAGAFVNLLNSEIEGLLKASKFNFGRMIFGNNAGTLCTTVAYTSATGSVCKVNSVKNIMEGMCIDLYSSGDVKLISAARITAIDRINKVVTLSKSLSEGNIAANSYMTVQGSKGMELTGLKSIFEDSRLYGLSKATNSWLNPYNKTSSTISSETVQAAIDYIDEVAGGTVDMIVTAYDVKRFYLDYLDASRTNIDYMNLDGGYNAISHGGIPFVSDRFVPDGTCYFLNTSDFKLHQLCDWRWLEGDGGTILHQKAGYPTYSATLVKYADLICDRPIGQARLTGITGAAS